MNDKPIICIFMPVYNGSAYLRESINSVLSQTFERFELVCVDDSSTDDSYSILREFAKKDGRVVVLQKPNGGSVPRSWNFAMPFLRGDFISYMSQDDLMSPDNLESSYTRSRETGADIVVPDMVHYYGADGKNPVQIGVKGDRSAVITGREAFVLSLGWEIHGFTLCKAAIMKSEKLDESSFNSDEYVMRKNFFMSPKVAFSRGKYFFRKNNPGAITKVFKFHTITSLLTDQRLIEFMENNRIEPGEIHAYMYRSFRTLVYIYIAWLDAKRNHGEKDRAQALAMMKNHLFYLKSRSFYAAFSGITKAVVIAISCNWSVFTGAVYCARLYKKAAALLRVVVVRRKI